MEDIDINTLRGNPKNPRTINKHDYSKLLQSIQKFGDLSGIVLNRTTGQLVGGHQRIQAFKQLGGRPTVTERYEQPNSKGTIALGYVLLDDEKYGYREVEWQPDFEIAANIAANRIQGEFDKDLLAELIYEVNAQDNGAELIDLMGVTNDEVSKLLSSISGDEELDDRYSQALGEVTYEPKETNHKVQDLFETCHDYDAEIEALQNEDLKTMLRMRAAYFGTFNFAKIADYFAYQATPQEQAIFEKLALVLLDKDKLVENGFADLMKDVADDDSE